MAAQNAEPQFIKDTRPEEIREKDEKKLRSKKTKEKIDVEEFTHKVDEEKEKK
jgi:hypothetical protein